MAAWSRWGTCLRCFMGLSMAVPSAEALITAGAAWRKRRKPRLVPDAHYRNQLDDLWHGNVGVSFVREGGRSTLVDVNA